MEATVVTPFRGAPDGEVYPRAFEVGETVFGRLAAAAVSAGWAVAGEPAAAQPKKRRSPRGRKS